MAIDFKAIRAKAESYADDMTKFMCDLIAIPGESCQEGPTVQRIKQEMEKVGFDIKSKSTRWEIFLDGSDMAAT